MLEYYPLKRASAQKMLSHRWLKMKPNYDYKMSETEYAEFMARKQQAQAESPDSGHEMYPETEDNEGDDESDDMKGLQDIRYINGIINPNSPTSKTNKSMFKDLDQSDDAE